MSCSQNISVRRGVFFNWLAPLVQKSNEQPLEPSDLPDLPAEYDPLRCAQRFAKAADQATSAPEISWLIVQDGKMGSISPLVKVLFRCHSCSLLKISFLRAIGCVLSFTVPLVMGRMVSYFDSDRGLNEGFILVAALSALSLLSAMININANSRAVDLRIKLQSALQHLIYFRVMSLPLVAWKDLSLTDAQISTILQVDVDQASGCMQNLNDLWLLPLQVFIAFALLYFQIRIAFIAGVCVIVIMIPLNSYIAREIGLTTADLLRQKDQRMRVLLQALQSVTSMKLCGLEKSVLRESNKFREAEVLALARRKYLDAACVFLWAFTPVLVPFVALATAKAVGVELTAARIVVTLALLNTLIHPMNAFPWVINGLLEARVSLQRLATVLNAHNDREVCLRLGFETRCGSTETERVLDPPRPASFTLPGHCYRWTRSGPSLGLAAPLVVEGGQLVAITGLTGSGKTSLLLGLLQELHTSDGSADSNFNFNFNFNDQASFSSHTSSQAIQLLAPSSSSSSSSSSCAPRRLSLGEPGRPWYFSSGSVCYAAQSPRLFSGSVRFNITLGEGFDPARYQCVLRGTGLEVDVQAWPQGDLKEVGAQASALSTGQALRVALARCLYSRAPLVVLDDPFSALDAHTAAGVMSYLHHCVLATERRAVVLCTHQVHLVAGAHTVVVMREGLEAARGTYAQLAEASLDFQSLVYQLQLQLQLQHQFQSSSSPAATAASPAAPHGPLRGEGEAGERLSYPLGETDEADAEDDSPAQEDNCRRGHVDRQALGAYLSAMGPLTVSGLCVSLLAMQATAVLAQYYYTQRAAADRPPVFLATAGLCVSANAVATALRAVLFARGGLAACQRLYTRLAASVLGCQTARLEDLAVGALATRLGRDTNVLDDRLPFVLNILLAQAVAVLSSVGVMLASTPAVLPALLLSAAAFHRLQRRYRRLARDLRRAEAAARSPVATFVLQSVQACVAVRWMAPAGQAALSRAWTHKLAGSLRAALLLHCAGQYLAARMQTLSVALTTALAAILVLSRRTGLWPLSAAAAGLALLYANNAIATLAGMINAFIETEQEMIAVERVCEYCALPEDESLSRPLLGEGRGTGREERERRGEREGRSVPEGRSEVCGAAAGGGPDGGRPRGAATAARARTRRCWPPPPPRTATTTPTTSDEEAARPPAACPRRTGWASPGYVHFRFFRTSSGVRVSGLSVRYGPSSSTSSEVLRDVSLHVAPGSRVAVVGRTGCGKSTLLRCLTRLTAFQRGDVWLGESRLRDIVDLRGKVGLVPQRGVLCGGSLAETVMRGGPRALSRADVAAFLRTHPGLLALLLTHFSPPCTSEGEAGEGEGEGEGEGGLISRLLDLDVGSLAEQSAGHGQLLALVRALLRASDFLVLDEVTAAWDTLTTACVYQVLRDYCDQRPGTVLLMVCHRLEEVHLLCNKVLKLENGQVATYEDIEDYETF